MEGPGPSYGRSWSGCSCSLGSTKRIIRLQYPWGVDRDSRDDRNNKNNRDTRDNRDRNINITTVYRILEKLDSMHLVHEFEGKWKKCQNLNNQNQHHFLICQVCGYAEEIFLDYKSSISDQLAKEKGFLLREVKIGFIGKCKRCR